MPTININTMSILALRGMILAMAMRTVRQIGLALLLEQMFVSS